MSVTGLHERQESNHSYGQKRGCLEVMEFELRLEKWRGPQEKQQKEEGPKAGQGWVLGRPPMVGRFVFRAV